ncbi:MAG TPA: NAD-dependent 4,6-dehydratase LegB [Candidatus Omnitrophota bacterium]|nr:NAD-dependent 4,6-dehydratase LegB [Candidatus Omnitrophota bacterium]
MNWKNKRVLVTGADGFIGSHLVERLVEKGASVRAFVYYNSFNSWGWIEQAPKKILQKIDVFTGDVRDPNGVQTAMEGTEIVFHLAALIGIPFSYHSPDSYIDTNVKGTLNVLQAARKLKVKRIVHTSTSEVYGTAQYVPIDESHPINPQSPYAASKSAADSLALSFYRSFDLPVTILRPFNTFGPRQSARAIIPTIVSQIYSGKKAIELGNLDVSRDFNYVGNTVEAFLKIAEAPKAVGQVFNSGSGVETTLPELIDVIQRVIKRRVKVKRDQKRKRPPKSEVYRLVANATKLHTTTNWKDKISLEEGLRSTCHWIKKNIRTYKPDIYNV